MFKRKSLKSPLKGPFKTPLKIFPTLLIFIIFFTDQLSKWWVMEQWYKADQATPGFFSWLTQTGDRFVHPPIKITEFFNMVMVWNEGISFGIFSSGGAIMVWMLSFLAIGIATIFFVWMHRTTSGMLRAALALVIGGALGNVADRLRYGAVADFFDFHLLDYHWPAFNIADSVIVIGMILFIWDTFFLNPAGETEQKHLMDKVV